MKVDDDLARQVIKPRLRESHKGSYGRVLLVGGLYPYGGAIIMAAIACVTSFDRRSWCQCVWML